MELSWRCTHSGHWWEYTGYPPPHTAFSMGAFSAATIKANAGQNKWDIHVRRPGNSAYFAFVRFEGNLEEAKAQAALIYEAMLAAGALLGKSRR